MESNKDNDYIARQLQSIEVTKHVVNVTNDDEEDFFLGQPRSKTLSHHLYQAGPSQELSEQEKPVQPGLILFIEFLF